MRYQKAYRLSYTVRDDMGFAVERRVKFNTIHDAMAFARSLRGSPHVLGKPTLERK